MVRKVKVKLELLTDIDMQVMQIKDVRGINHAIHGKIHHKDFDLKKVSSYLKH